MCGRYVIMTQEENEELRNIINEINDRYIDEKRTPAFKTGEIFPSDTAPILTSGSGGKPAVQLFKWGFPNFKQTSQLLINARSETLLEKPTFRRIISSNRCLVPASGFFEWKNTENGKEKHLIRKSGCSLLYMAGLYNSFLDKSGKQQTSFVIITTSASIKMSEIHSRMPVILGSEAMDYWLDPKAEFSNQAAIDEILRPVEQLNIQRL